MTSNLGSNFLADQSLDQKAKHNAVMGVVRKAFRPEFLNRLDEIVMFSPLSRDDLAQIVVINLSRINRRLAGRRITIEVSEAGRSWLADRGYDPVYGARPLRRLLQTTVEDQLARKLLAGEISDGQKVTFDVTSVGDELEIVSVE